MIPVRLRFFGSLRGATYPAAGIRYIPLLIALLVSLGSCEAVFTYSPLSGLQRDPSSLPTGQKITYAENALASGDPDAIRQAYDAIDEELQDGGLDAGTEEVLRRLAVDLSLEASGILQAALDLGVYAMSEEGLTDAQAKTRLDLMLDTVVDLAYVNEAVGQVAAATAGGFPVTGNQLVLAGMAEVCQVAAANPGGFSSLGPSLELDAAFQTVAAGVALLEGDGASPEMLGGLTSLLEFIGYP